MQHVLLSVQFLLYICCPFCSRRVAPMVPLVCDDGYNFIFTRVECPIVQLDNEQLALGSR